MRYGAECTVSLTTNKQRSLPSNPYSIQPPDSTAVANLLGRVVLLDSLILHDGGVDATDGGVLVDTIGRDVIQDATLEGTDNDSQLDISGTNLVPEQERAFGLGDAGLDGCEVTG